MWEACGAFNMPVAIHVSDPEAFFLPTDGTNERFEELNNHPDWSFHGKDFPSNLELLEARNRMIAKHPKTQFVVLHVGNDAENLTYVSECMDRFPNMSVEMAARVGELGRQPRTSRKFFDKYQDRILFGTDAVPNGTDTPQQIYGDELTRFTSLPRNRRRILRLRPRSRSAPRPLANLRDRLARRHPEKGLQRKRCSTVETVKLARGFGGIRGREHLS